MATDPILREVYRMKDQFAREMGYDLKKMCDHLREEDKKHPERLVFPPSKTAAPAKRRAAKGKKAE